MKKYISALFALAFLFAGVACTPENNEGGGGNKNNPEELTVTGEVLNVTDDSATLTGYAYLPLELGDAEVGIMYDKSQSFDNPKKVVAGGLDGNNMFTVTASGLLPCTTYYFKSYVQNGMAMKYGAAKSFATKESEWPVVVVDLGIVMTREDGTTYQLYWAKSNLSGGLCANPEDYGDTFAWGETISSYSYGWNFYKWCNGSSSSLTKYNTNSSYGSVVDNITELQRGENDGETVDDAARAKLGGKWRMPTDAEWTALKNTCTWVWETRNFVNGYKVTGPNGNSIFLPAAGNRVDGTHYLFGTNKDGRYWSSSLNTDDPNNARIIYFNSINVRNGNGLRFFGLSIRPVYEE